MKFCSAALHRAAVFCTAWCELRVHDVSRCPKYIDELNLIAAAASNFEIAFAFCTVRCGGIAKF
nr:hypothetical protein [uncultured Campylobacter sp.]